jgi:excisionase family DNA binding protein
MEPRSTGDGALLAALAEALGPAVEAAVAKAVERTLGKRGLGHLLTLAQAAEVLAVSVQHVRGLVAKGTLPAVRVGHSVRVRAEDVERVVAEGTGPAYQ